MHVSAAPHQLTALTIAGFDPGSGAGVTADLLTFASFGVFATSAITALTVQSTRGVRRVEPVDAGLLRETLAELEEDLPPTGIKLGMLGGVAQVRVVAEYLRKVRTSRALTVVLDPVIVSSSGHALLDLEGLALLQEEVLQLVDVVTPNLREAGVLAGMPCGNAIEAEACARSLQTRYPGLTPIITGGHFQRPQDLILHGSEATWIDGEHIASRSTHGTGCAFSSALLAGRLGGEEWVSAARIAKQFVRNAIRTAVPRGSGQGPLNLLSR